MDNTFPITTTDKLKHLVNKTAKESNILANTVLQNYMMERLLERIIMSKYKDNVIIKGGFLIAAMIGIDMRNTMDIDATIKGLPLSQSDIEKIISEIISIPANDGITLYLVFLQQGYKLRIPQAN